jgi:glycosyltransferase involved in cell wall biosynthesis
MNEKKIGILCIQGLPARYGAFEQTVSQLVEYSAKFYPDIRFYVGCSKASEQLEFDKKNVIRVFSLRTKGLGIIKYGILSFLKMYLRGVRVYFSFGYGIAPFFPVMRLLGCHLVCNVDGFEWRRQKWGTIHKIYFKICESMAAKFASVLIFDSECIRRYYRLNHKVSGALAFYGSETYCSKINSDQLPAALREKTYFVVVMRLEPENNIKKIVDAFIASNSTHSLVIVGPETSYFNLNVLPIVSGCDRIVWLGPIYNRELLWSIRANAVGYIHGHSVGGTNPTLVEACKIGRPIIAFQTTFNREVLGGQARYFISSSDLTNVINHFDYEWIAAPVLSSDYEWSEICEKYIKTIA